MRVTLYLYTLGESEVLVNFLQGSKISTFAAKKSKAKNSNNVEGSNDVSAFTQAT